MNSYVRIGFTPWAYKLSDGLLQQARKILHRKFDMAMNNLWKECLWSKYKISQSGREDTFRDSVTLRSLCHVVPVSQVDQRFASLLLGQDCHVHFSFHDLETAMKSEDVFNNWTEISSSETGSTYHLIYLASENSYLILHRNEDGILLECEIIMMEVKDDPTPAISVLGNFCLLWIYSNADIL
jgi:hypothetical protein